VFGQGESERVQLQSPSLETLALRSEARSPAMGILRRVRTLSEKNFHFPNESLMVIQRDAEGCLAVGPRASTITG
jgi:hypothetical protein